MKSLTQDTMDSNAAISIPLEQRKCTLTVRGLRKEKFAVEAQLGFSPTLLVKCSEKKLTLV